MSSNAVSSSPAVLRRCPEQLERVLRSLEPDERRRDVGGFRKELQARGGDHAERAFGADEQGFEVVSGVVLAQAAKAGHHAAVREHHLETEHQIAHHSIAQHRGTAGIGRQVAADLRRALRAEAQGEKPVLRLRGRLRLGERAAGLHDHRVIVHVDAPHPIEPPQRQHDLRARFVGRRAAAIARVAAVRHHGELVAIANGQDPRDLSHLARHEHQRRRALVQARESRPYRAIDREDASSQPPSPTADFSSCEGSRPRGLRHRRLRSQRGSQNRLPAPSRIAAGTGFKSQMTPRYDISFSM